MTASTVRKTPIHLGQDDAGLSHVFAHGPGAFAGRHCHVAFLPFGAGGDDPTRMMVGG